MAKINTLNYQTVASWNGSQDLFVVEQPDGTKVATPAMVKQFMEAGDFAATGEIKDGHGNILAAMAKNTDIDSLTAGRAMRYVKGLANNASVEIALSTDFSVNSEFALVALNIGGNALAGLALLVLGRGTGKIKDLIGAMPTTSYEATYSNNKWTIKNKSGSTVHVTVLYTKGTVN